VIEEFVDETEAFVESYCRNDEKPEQRIVDYDAMLDEVRNLLERIKKRLPLR